MSEHDFIWKCKFTSLKLACVSFSRWSFIMFVSHKTLVFFPPSIMNGVFPIQQVAEHITVLSYLLQCEFVSWDLTRWVPSAHAAAVASRRSRQVQEDQRTEGNVSCNEDSLGYEVFCSTGGRDAQNPGSSWARFGKAGCCPLSIITVESVALFEIEVGGNDIELVKECLMLHSKEKK